MHYIGSVIAAMMESAATEKSLNEALEGLEHNGWNQLIGSKVNRLKAAKSIKLHQLEGSHGVKSGRIESSFF